MITFVDKFLDNITMYRLLLYYLILLVVVAFVYSLFGILPFSPIALVFSTGVILATCFVTNKVFAFFFKVQTNLESLYITALILVLIITPNVTLKGLEFLVLASFLAMASKYILNIRGKHIFNPAAIAVVITSMTISGYASWWVGTLVMFPFSLLGVFIARKIRRFNLVFWFFVFSIAGILIRSFSFEVVRRVVVDSPILFFAFVMLTEPLTTPPTSFLQSLYGGIVGVLFLTTPEMALVIGNIFSYIVSPKEKLTLKLKEKIKLTSDIYDFIFESSKSFKFKAGQYMEWTLGHKNTDDRGNRRYFTIASSPAESEVRIGMKLPEDKPSSFKKSMLDMKIGSEIVAASLAGDFTMPREKYKKLVFIAGGIGITPFRSIIKYLLEKQEKRDIILIYSEKNIKEMVYKDVFDEGSAKLGIKVIYFETEKSGHIDMKFIEREIPDFKSRIFYLSGPQGMVKSFRLALKESRVSEKQIKTDYFPGYA